MGNDHLLYVGQVSEYALIFNEFGEVLLLVHDGGGDPHYYGKYHLPGGRMDKDDVPGEGLLREIIEETGIEDIELLLPCQASRWGVETQEFGKKYSVIYLATVEGRPQPVLPAQESHIGSGWFPYAEALKKTYLFEGELEAVQQAGEWAKKLGVLKNA